MSDVKGRLKEILNTSLGGHQKKTSYDFNHSKRTFYSPSKEKNTLDLSIDNFKRTKSPRLDSFNSSIFNKSPQYSPIATQSSNAPTSSSSRKGFNFSNNSKISNLDLIIPSSNTPLYFSKYSTARIKREISDIHKTITIGSDRYLGFRNRPAVNLNRKELEFNSREFFATSPTVTNRNLLTTSNTIRKYGDNQNKFIRNGNSNLFLNNMNTLAQRNFNEFEDFARELVPNTNKFSVFDKYSLNRRKKSAFY